MLFTEEEKHALVDLPLSSATPSKMGPRSPSPEFSPLSIGEDLTPLPIYKTASTTSVNFSDLLEPPLKLHEDLKVDTVGGQDDIGLLLNSFFW